MRSGARPLTRYLSPHDFSPERKKREMIVGIAQDVEARRKMWTQHHPSSEEDMTEMERCTRSYCEVAGSDKGGLAALAAAEAGAGWEDGCDGGSDCSGADGFDSVVF